MNIRDLKMSINLTEKNIKKHLTDLETILEFEGLQIRSVDIEIFDLNIPEIGEKRDKNLVEIIDVNIDVRFQT